VLASFPGRRKNGGCQEKTVSRLLILEPEVRLFRAAFIVAKVASTVSGTPAGAHNVEREVRWLARTG